MNDTSINVWTMADGRTVHIPADIFAQTKFAKTGLPDKRAKDNAAFYAWLEKQEAAGAGPTDLERAKILALRIWAGQSPDLGVGDRKERIRRALEGQGLSMDGVKLPIPSRDESDWTAEDEAPVVWRTQRTA